MPQPDNAEFDINESVEACMGILNDISSDGIKYDISPVFTHSTVELQTLITALL